MNLLHITSQGSAGAGRVVFELHTEMLRRGINSHVLTLRKDDAYHIGVSHMLNSNLHEKTNRLYRKVRRVLTGQRYPSFERDAKYSFFIPAEEQFFTTPQILARIPFKPDAVLIHFNYGLLSFKNINEMYGKLQIPFFWHFRDLFPITGGCHYSWDCQQYQSDCSPCPAIIPASHKNWASKILAKRNKLISAVDISAISGTNWVLNKAKVSALFGNKPSYRVMNGIEGSAFGLVPKTEAKATLGIDANLKSIFLGSTHLYETRKGMSHALEALNALSNLWKGNASQDIMLLLAGRADENLLKQIPIPFRYIGYLKTKEQLAQAYQAADVFLCPSIQDAGPLMVSESLMCGTPVVAYAMGVATDEVITGKTGYLAQLGNASDLAQGLFEILNLPHNAMQSMQESCRQLAVELHSYNQQVERYIEVIKERIK